MRKFKGQSINMEEDFNQPLDIEAISVAQVPKERNITPQLLEEAFSSKPAMARSSKKLNDKRVMSCYASLPFEQKFVSPAFPDLEDIDKAVEKRLSFPPSTKIDTKFDIPVTAMNKNTNNKNGNDALPPIPLPKDDKIDKLIIKKTRKVFQPNGAFADGPSDAKEYFRVLSSEFNHFAQKFTSKKPNNTATSEDVIIEPKFNEEKKSRRVKSFNPEKLMHFRYSMNLTGNNVNKIDIENSNKTTRDDENKIIEEVPKLKETRRPSFGRARASSVSLTNSFKSMGSIKPLYSVMSHTNPSQPSQEVLKAIAVDEKEEKNIIVPAAYRLDPVYTTSVSSIGRQRHRHRRNGSKTSSVPTFSSGVRSSMSDVSDSSSLPQNIMLHVRRAPSLRPLPARPMSYPVHNKPLPITPSSGSQIRRSPSRVTRSAKHRSKRESNSPPRFKISPNLTPRIEADYVTSRYNNFAKQSASELELPPACKENSKFLHSVSLSKSHNIDSLDEVLGTKTLMNNDESNDNVSLKSKESFDTIEQIIHSYGRLNGDSRSEIFDKEAGVSTVSPSSSTTSLTLNLNNMDKNIDGLYENIENMKDNMFKIDKNIQLMDKNMHHIDKSMKNMDKAMKDLDEKFSEVSISNSGIFNCYLTQSNTDLTKSAPQSQREETKVTPSFSENNSSNPDSFNDKLSAHSALTVPQQSPASPTSTVFFSCRESLGGASSVFSGNQSSDESSVSSGSEHNQYHYNNTYPVKEDTVKLSTDNNIRQASIYVKHKSGFVSPITKIDQNKFRDYNNHRALNAKQLSGYVKTGIPPKSQFYGKNSGNFVDTEYERMRKGSDMEKDDLSSLSSFSTHRRTESNESDFSYAESTSSKIKNVEIPKDTSVFTRNPTYKSQISHSFSCYSKSSKVAEDPNRMTSVNYFKKKGISPFSHSGYEKSKTLRITNMD